MRYVLIVLLMLFCSATSALAQVSVSIGINQPIYPQLVRVPGYPVYYAPRAHANFFFYDGMYWVYQRDNWYASSWYNGPWRLVAPALVPLFVLRIPVRYYRAPPVYFRGWAADAPPRWGDHWGNEWAQHRSGWDRWNHRSAPAPAPLPVYQRQYSGKQYPRAVQQQQALHNRNYRYQPRDALVRQHAQEPAAQKTPAAHQRRLPDRQRAERPTPPRQGERNAPHPQSQQKRGEDAQRPAPPHALPRQKPPAIQEQRRAPQQGASQHERQAPKRGHGQDKKREKLDERAHERNR